MSSFKTASKDLHVQFKSDIWIKMSDFGTARGRLVRRGQGDLRGGPPGLGVSLGSLRYQQVTPPVRGVLRILKYFTTCIYNNLPIWSITCPRCGVWETTFDKGITDVESRECKSGL